MSRPGPTTKRRILIVDDQPGNIEVLVSALEDTYELFFATGGARALQVVDSTKIDLVLLDVVMPEMDGYEVCRRLKSREDTRDIPVIFVTGLGEVDDEMTGFAIGGVDYITKPVSLPIVRARVRTHIELKEQRDLLATLAATDPLTGLGNRRQFDRLVEEEWQRAMAMDRPVALMILDVDDFKQFNDLYGHARGDECLQAIARTLDASLRRRSDVVSRHGGEEFAALLADVEPDAVIRRVQDLLEAMASLAIPHARSRCASHVTVSLGAVTVKPTRRIAPSEVMQVADELLYAAKEGGRNRGMHLDMDRQTRRVVLAESSSPAPVRAEE